MVYAEQAALSAYPEGSEMHTRLMAMIEKKKAGVKGLPPLVEALSTSDIGLLFLDNAHRLKSEDRDMIQEVVKSVGEVRQFGLVMTSEIDQPEFEIIRQHPTALATMVLKHLDVTENFHALKAHDERFAPWVKRYVEKESSANELAGQLRGITQGNFQRIASLCLSLRNHIKETSLSLESINEVLRKRGL